MKSHETEALAREAAARESLFGRRRCYVGQTFRNTEEPVQPRLSYFITPKDDFWPGEVRLAVYFGGKEVT